MNIIGYVLLAAVGIFYFRGVANSTRDFGPWNSLGVPYRVRVAVEN
jgi:hypothetical protein